MLSSRAPLATAARHTPRSRRIAVSAISLCTLCAQLGCMSPPASSSRSAVVAPIPEPVALGGIRVRMQSRPTDEPAASPTIVYLSANRPLPMSGGPVQLVEIGRNDDGLSPAFITTAIRQSVRFRVVDDIHHHLFSKSKTGAFDLGSLGKGESRRISFEKPGMLRLYCSLHPSENAALFVAPSPHFARVPDSGQAVLTGLLPGRYQLHAWSESRPSSVMDVEVRAGAFSRVEIQRPGRRAEN